MLPPAPTAARRRWLWGRRRAPRTHLSPRRMSAAPLRLGRRPCRLSGVPRHGRARARSRSAFGGGSHLAGRRCCCACLAGWRRRVLWLANLTAEPLELPSMAWAKLRRPPFSTPVFSRGGAGAWRSRCAGPAVRSRTDPRRLCGRATREPRPLDNEPPSFARRREGGEHGRPSPQGFRRHEDPKFGHFIVEFATPGIGHILKSAGCDFVLFDLEHSGFGFETVKSAIRYFEAADVPMIVRAPSKEYHHIARAMDMGAEGLMLPMVGSAAEAKHILNSHEIHPRGRAAASPSRSPMTAIVRALSPRNSPRPTSAARSSARSRRRKASRTPMPSRPCPASIASGSAISTSRYPSAFLASSNPRNSPTPSSGSPPRRPSTASPWAAWCRRWSRG